MSKILVDVENIISGLNTAYSQMDFSSIIREVSPAIRWCEDCESFYRDDEGGFSHTEPEVWLCNDDLAEREKEE